MNSEFGRGPHPDKGACCPSCHGGGAMNESAEDSWWRSMEELVPIFEREGINLNIEPHPEDWVETLQPSVDFIRTINSDRVKFLYCMPHTFYFGDDTISMLKECADVLAHVHIADTFNHKASSGLRYIVNPPGSDARVHQHLDMGQGEVPWEGVFQTLGEIGFDGIMTVCVFAWEERADDSGKFNRKRIDELVAKHFNK